METKQTPLDQPRPPDDVETKVNFRTIKTSLKSIVKNQDLIPKIDEIVKRCNYIVSDTYAFIRLYILYKYHNNLKIPKLSKTFIKDCMNILGFKNKRGRQAEFSDDRKDIADFYLNEYQPINNHKKLDLRNIGYILDYLVISIRTSIIVNIKEHLIKRLFRFVNVVAGKYYDDNYDDHKLDNKLYNKTKNAELYKLKTAIVNCKEAPEFFKEWFDEHETDIVPQNIKKSMAYDCKANPWKYLKPSIYMALKLEEYNDNIRDVIAEKQDENEIKNLSKKIVRLFQVLPLRNSNIPKYITFDTAALISCFNIKDKHKLRNNIIENKSYVWSTFFNMNKKVFKDTKNHKFHYMIQTDGVGCSIMMSPKNYIKSWSEISLTDNTQDEKQLAYIDNLSKTKLSELSKKKIVVADPGKLNLVYMMDDQNNKLRYTCKQRDTESLSKKNRIIMKNNKEKNKNIIPAETELSNYLSTTVDYDKFKDFVKAKDTANEQTRNFYEDKLYRKLNWRAKTNRQKSQDKFINKIEKTFGKKEDIVICIGDWSNPQGSCIKGAPTINLGLKRMISKKYQVLLIDEYNTSKKCCNCGNNLKNHKMADKKIFRILTCENCKNKHIGRPTDKNTPMGHSSSFINRDVNSCLNMIKIAKSLITGKGRPDIYKRTRSKNLLSL